MSSKTAAPMPDVIDRPGAMDLTLIEPKGSTTQPGNGAHIVAHEQDGTAGARHLPHFAQAFPLKSGITDGKHFYEFEYSLP